MKMLCLIFSKDRAAQLLALLESFHYFCSDIEMFDIVILYKTSSQWHQDQYSELEESHPGIQFILENTFEKDVRALLTQKYILFLVDDCIFINSFRMQDAASLLESQQDCIGVSLRLGSNITYCYPKGISQAQPEFFKYENALMKFNWVTSEHDFGYPMEVSSSLYRVEDVIFLLNSHSFATVNHLEGILMRRSSAFKISKPFLLSYLTSRAFCNPLNIVSCVGTSTNRKSQNMDYKSDELSRKFGDNLKIDISKFIDFIPIGCHQEVDIKWMKRA